MARLVLRIGGLSLARDGAGRSEEDKRTSITCIEMQGKYLGDSYDLVKRFWSESLRVIAPLYAYPTFVPAGIQSEYSKVTLIQILDIDSLPRGPFGVLVDPDTGITLPDDSWDGARRSHVSLRFIIRMIEELRPRYVICFDQSYHRDHELTRTEQRELKMKVSRKCGMACFYYLSQVPFFFMAQSGEILGDILHHLIALGVPVNRFEPGHII